MSAHGVSAYPPVGAEGHGPEAEGRDTQARRAQEAVVVELGQRLVNACLFGGRLIHLGFLRLLCLCVDVGDVGDVDCEGKEEIGHSFYMWAG